MPWQWRLAWSLLLIPAASVIVVALAALALIIPGGALLQAAECIDGSCEVRASVHSSAVAHVEGGSAWLIAGASALLGVLAASLVVSRSVRFWHAWRDQPYEANEVSWPIAVATAAYLALDTALLWALLRWLTS
jgi:hypothetical protein